MNSSQAYQGISRDGQTFVYHYPRNPSELVELLKKHTDICKVALLVLTPFEPPRDGSSGPEKQYFTGWALAHIRTLLRQYGQAKFVQHLRLIHEYIAQGGAVRNPIGLFTYRLRQEPVAV